MWIEIDEHLINLDLVSIVRYDEPDCKEDLQIWTIVIDKWEFLFGNDEEGALDLYNKIKIFTKAK